MPMTAKNPIIPVDLGMQGSTETDVLMGKLKKFGDKTIMQNKSDIEQAAINDANNSVLERDADDNLVYPQVAKKSFFRELTGYGSVSDTAYEKTLITKYINEAKLDLNNGIRTANVETDNIKDFIDLAAVKLDGYVNNAHADFKQEFLLHGSKVFNEELLKKKKALAIKEAKKAIAEYKVVQQGSIDTFLASEREADSEEIRDGNYEIAVETINNNPSLGEEQKKQKIINLKYDGDVAGLLGKLGRGFELGLVDEATALQLITQLKKPKGLSKSHEKNVKKYLKSTVKDMVILDDAQKKVRTSDLISANIEDIRNNLLTPEFLSLYGKINGVEEELKIERTIGSYSMKQQTYDMNIVSKIIRGDQVPTKEVVRVMALYPKIAKYSTNESQTFLSIGNLKQSDLDEKLVNDKISKPGHSKQSKYMESKDKESKEYLDDPTQKAMENRIHEPGTFPEFMYVKDQGDKALNIIANYNVSQKLIAGLRLEREDFEANPDNAGKVYDLEDYYKRKIQPFMDDYKERETNWLKKQYIKYTGGEIKFEPETYIETEGQPVVEKKPEKKELSQVEKIKQEAKDRELLDSLGISKKDVTDKMKQTGDDWDEIMQWVRDNE